MSSDTSFRNYFEETQNLLATAERDFEKFQVEVFLEIEKFHLQENLNVLHIIMLRKKIMIQIFNFTCIVFKTKRLLKRITDALYKLEPWEKQKRMKKGSHRRNEKSISISQDKELLEVEPKFSATPSIKTQSMQDLNSLNDFTSMIKSESVQEETKVSNLKSLKELEEKDRPRMSSIDVIMEENENMLNEAIESPNKKEETLESKSESAEILPESKIDIEDLENQEDEQPKTDDMEVIDLDPHAEQESIAEIFEDLISVLDSQEDIFLDNENFKQLQKGFLSQKTGINNIVVPINKYDVGSIIAYSLSTNCYYEGLARQNFLEFRSKFEHNSAEELELNNKLNTGNKIGGKSNKGPKDYVEKRDGFGGLQDKTSTSNFKSEGKKEDMIILNDKTDVLDSEYQPHHIESEFLSYQKINFKQKWNTENKQVKMKVIQNIFKVDNIQGEIQQYCHKDKNMDELVLPAYSKNFLDDENIVNLYMELNEIKKNLELNTTKSATKSRRNRDNISIDSSSSSTYNLATPGLKLAKTSASQQTFDMVAPRNNDFIPDLVITPVQPPVHQLTEKYKNKKVASILNEENLDFEVNIYFPKKFEALRKFYCGSHEEFIKSIMKTSLWSDNSGGKTNTPFFKSGDEKYVFKEVKAGDIRMFTDFTFRYFDYLCKSFFHNFPCALAKILGVYMISIKTHGRKKTISEKYYVVAENLNYGIKDENDIVRYDLKGSTRSRFVKIEPLIVPRIGAAKVCLDINFMLDNKSRPMALKNAYYKILMI